MKFLITMVSALVLLLALAVADALAPVEAPDAADDVDPLLLQAASSRAQATPASAKAGRRMPTCRRFRIMTLGICTTA
jgi:hypothetical protein